MSNLRPSHPSRALLRLVRVDSASPPLDASRIWAQVDVVLALIGELEAVCDASDEGRLDRQSLVEELTRLGCRVLETAAAVARPDALETARRAANATRDSAAR